MTTATSRLLSALRSPLVPVWLVVFLLPFGRTAELGTLLCLVGAIVVALRNPAAFTHHRGVHLLLWLWAAYIGAAIISLPDAWRFGRSGLAVAGYLRFVPLGVFTCFAVRSPKRLHVLIDAVAVVVALWALDAWVQVFTGYSLGGHAQAVRVTGIFGAGNMKLGLVLASLAPFVLWSAREHLRRPGLAVAFVFLLGPILLAGARAAWITYALVGLAFAWRESRSPARFALWCVGACVAAVIAVGLAWQFSPRFHDRAARTLKVFHGTEAGLNTALSGRLDIWHVAWDMYLAHPVNGVGVREFRYAYPTYALPDDRFIGPRACDPGAGACHPHQLVLEILTNTGSLGLVLWLAAVVLAWRRWREVGDRGSTLAFPATVALAVTVFPFNTHLAFYSAWWGLLFWWLLALWCAALYVKPEDAHGT